MRSRKGSPKYTEAQRAQFLAALEANDGNAKKTARELGIPRTTLRHLAQRVTDVSRAKLHQDTPTEAVEALAGKWKRLADKSVDLALQAMEGLTEAELRAMRAKDVRELVVSGAVATEKHQLLSGKPTQRAEIASLVDLFRQSGDADRAESGTARPYAGPPIGPHVSKEDKASGLSLN